MTIKTFPGILRPFPGLREPETHGFDMITNDLFYVLSPRRYSFAEIASAITTAFLPRKRARRPKISAWLVFYIAVLGQK